MRRRVLWRGDNLRGRIHFALPADSIGDGSNFPAAASRLGWELSPREGVLDGGRPLGRGRAVAVPS